MSVKARPLAAVAAVLALALSGCTLFGDDGEPEPPQATAAGIPADPPDRLREPRGVLRAEALVAQVRGRAVRRPDRARSDYAEPDGDTIKVKVLRCRPAASRAGSARWWSTRAAREDPGSSTRRPPTSSSASRCGSASTSSASTRGACGRSAPINCLDDAQLDDVPGRGPDPGQRRGGAGLRPDGQGLRRRLQGQRRAAARPRVDRRRRQGHGHPARRPRRPEAELPRQVLRHLPRRHLRRALPALVGQFVLDGVVPPDLTSAEVNEGQAAGFELATRAWAKDCVEEGDCPSATRSTR